MRMITLGRTGMVVSKNSIGALPLQRLGMDEAAALLRAAYDKGINFFDTARVYSDSEEKLGLAFHDIPDKVIIATKVAISAKTASDVRKSVETSLKMLRRGWIDLIQFHNPTEAPAGDDPRYAELVRMRQEGLVRHIGLTNHRRNVAEDAIASGLYETIQFPLSCLSTPEELSVIDKAASAGMGVLCMKAMCGGLLTSARPTMAVMDTYPNAVPIYGVQRMSELEEIVALDAEQPPLDEATRAFIERERRALGDEFCRGCGYCAPCPKGIQINTAARMKLLLNRSPWQALVTPERIADMKRIEDCINCGACKSRCPYGLDCPGLLKKNLEYYYGFLDEKGIAR